MNNNLDKQLHSQKVYLKLLNVRLYSASVTVRCGTLTHVPLKFELEYDNAPHRTANNAEYELTLGVG